MNLSLPRIAHVWTILRPEGGSDLAGEVHLLGAFAVAGLGGGERAVGGEQAPPGA